MGEAETGDHQAHFGNRQSDAVVGVVVRLVGRDALFEDLAGEGREGVKRHLWNVVYGSSFSSPSGMRPYTVEYLDKTGYVTTELPSVDSVREELRRVEGCQISVRIKSAHWLGEILSEQ